MADGEIYLWLGDTSRVAAKAVGRCLFNFLLACNGYSASFNKNSVSIINGVDEICSRMLIDNLYLIEPNTPLSINSYESNHKRKEPSSINQTHLWHLRLGHINLDRIRRLVTSGHLSPLDVTSLPVCERCLEGKMTMRYFKAKDYRAKKVLDLVHMDLYMPMRDRKSVV